MNILLIKIIILIVWASRVTKAYSKEISYVIEPFELISDWSSSIYNDEGILNLTILPEKSALYGEGALRIDYEVVSTETWGGFVDFGQSLDSGAHNCHGATHISFWYKTLEKQSLKGSSHIRLMFMDDSECLDDCSNQASVNIEYYYSFHYILDSNNTDWQEIRIELQGDENPESSFWLTGWGGQIGNGVLDPERLRGWKLQISIDSSGGLGARSKGVILVDQLSCIGSSELFGSAFFTKQRNNENLMNQSLEEGLWCNSYFNSLISGGESHLSSEGVFYMNYTIEKSSEWGGITIYEHHTPNNSYYNLSQSFLVSFAYEVWYEAYPSDRAQMYFKLLSKKKSVTGCTADPESGLKDYAFVEGLLDDQDSLGLLSFRFQNYTNSSIISYGSDWLYDIDLSMVGGFRFEFHSDSKGKYGSLVNGVISISNMQAVTLQNSELSVDNSNEAECIEEIGISFILDDNFTNFQRIEFLGGRCCESCELTDFCLFALSDGRDCYMTSYVHHKSIVLANNPYAKITIFSTNSTEKRGNFCEICSCKKSDRIIDCRERDLVLVPKVFLESWKPEILDLRGNPRLTFIGKSTLETIQDSLKEVKLPVNLKYLSEYSLSQMPSIESVIFEGNNRVSNLLFDSQLDFYGDICCGRGTMISTTNPSNGLTFCKMQPFYPGIDSVKFPFLQFVNPDVLADITPNSFFMAEAAESVDKCAEYCSISDRCKYFSYDARIYEAQHNCILLLSKGIEDFVCCKIDDFADPSKTLPGWTSGIPPRTRNAIENARVITSNNELLMNESNDYTTAYTLSLGSQPLRGAVWVTPMIASGNTLNVLFIPSRAVLYDNITKIEITIQIPDKQKISAAESFVVYNAIESCDAAFTVPSSENTIFVKITKTSSSALSITSALVPIAIASIFALVYLYVARQKRIADKVWIIQLKELLFDDPPEIIGRGTFGLVLSAQYRGTTVAVKRVIPPRITKKRLMISSEGLFGSGDNTDSLSLNHGFTSHLRNFLPKSSDSSSAKTKDFSSQSLSSSSIFDNTRDPSFKKIDASGLTQDKSNLISMDSSSVLNLSSKIISEDKETSFTQLDLSLKKSSCSLGENDSLSFLTRTRRYGIVKALTYSRSDEYSLLKADFIREMRHLSKLRHPCITTVMGAVMDRKEEPMLVMEYMDHGSLYDLLHNQTYTIKGEHILPILRDISSGLRFLHAATPKVIHGDLKAANILIDNKFRAKVADFGLSQKKQIGVRGTIFWMAPELLRREKSNDDTTDVYSFGIILYEVYSRREPYEGEEFWTVVKGITESLKRPPVPSSCPKEVKALMEHCLLENPEDRPSFEDIDLNLKKLEITNVEPRIVSLSLQENKEKEMTTSLLYDVFPQHVADALRLGKKVEPESRDMVTIFFSDIVGFTKISSALPAIKISQMLDRLYGKLDALSRKFDVFKVETIGDAYMAVTNLVKVQQDHTKRIAEFAICALKAANETLIDLENPQIGYVNMRVGFHVGPVVANVVGSRNPRYCLFGDTVNTASRMESNSEKNRIHCSERAAQLLVRQCPDMGLSCRGRIQIKGKGEMTTYWVNENSKRYNGSYGTSIASIRDGSNVAC